MNDEAVFEAWEKAPIKAQRATSLDEAFPVACPYSIAQAMDHDFWPE